MTLSRMPEDAEIVDMIRAGLVTIPDIAHKIYGYPAKEFDWIQAKNKVLNRLNQLEKYKIVRRTDRTVQMGYGRNVAKIWEVVE